MLVTESLSKSFGSLVAVDNVSLSVPAGSLHAVIGPNGAGKSTFFNLISGFFPPSAGRIVFDGQDVSRLSVTGRVAAGMARTFQITEIFPELSVALNLRIAVEAASGHPMRPWLSRHAEAGIEQRVAELVAQTGLKGKAERKVGELSHGDQRAVEIGMALALKPKLLLLDEPTAGMGDQETEQIAELMHRLHREQGLTIVLIEHDMQIVFRLADIITVLSEGRVLASGTPPEIARNEAVQAAYLGKQES
ncbi:MAG TPA: ABC transporter ATP-binding protein [Dongiaceae bacterium]|jgi:branched-chain amino acid transport system ATP-binding protein|nr:ABC transporter ATP-binding protein [Dongiaceae bacterium]